MQINTSTLFNLLNGKLSNEVKGKINSLSIDGKVDVTTLLKQKDISSIINSLFNDLLSNVKNKNSINKALLNSKDIFDTKSFTKDLKDILNQISKQNNLSKQSLALKNFLLDITSLDDKILKKNISNSGIFLESKLLKNDPNITSDLKANLLQIQEQIDNPKIQKVLNTIDYYQLLSYTSYSNNSFLPFVWDNVEDGSVSVNSNNKDMVTCSIELNLKKYGEFKAMLLIEKTNDLTINLNVKNKDFKNLIQDNLQELRKRINKIDLNLIGINIFRIEDNLSYEEKAYQNLDKINFDIDIKA